MAPQFLAGTEGVAVSLTDPAGPSSADLRETDDISAVPPRPEEIYDFGEIGAPFLRQNAMLSDPGYRAALESAVRKSQASPRAIDTTTARLVPVQD